jgi:hypothetical protein
MALHGPFAWMMNLRFAKGGIWSSEIHFSRIYTNASGEDFAKPTNTQPHVPIMTLRPRGGFGWTGLRQHLNLSNMFFLEFYTTLMTTFMTISISNLLAMLGFSYVTERLYERIKAIFVLNHYRKKQYIFCFQIFILL